MHADAAARLVHHSQQRGFSPTWRTTTGVYSSDGTSRSPGADDRLHRRHGDAQDSDLVFGCATRAGAEYHSGSPLPRYARPLLAGTGSAQFRERIRCGLSPLAGILPGPRRTNYSVSISSDARSVGCFHNLHAGGTAGHTRSLQQYIFSIRLSGQCHVRSTVWQQYLPCGLC